MEAHRTKADIVCTITEHRTKAKIVHTMTEPHSKVAPHTMTRWITMAMVAHRTSITTPFQHLAPWRMVTSHGFTLEMTVRSTEASMTATRRHLAASLLAGTDQVPRSSMHQFSPSQVTTPIHHQSLPPSTFGILRYTS
jgi:hypothetical protein